MPNNDSHQHVVKTSEQWNERMVEFWVVPRGCLCVELTPRGKTKLKIGEGNKYYSQLPYICDDDLSQYYTKTEVDNLLENFNRMAIMSTEEYDEKSDLPPTGNKLGDVRFVKSQNPSIKIDPDIYLWNGLRWVFVGDKLPDIDLSKYLKKTEFHELFDPVSEKVDEMYPMRHTHENKDVLDQITAPYTISEKEKLADLENYDDTEIRQLIHDTGHTHPNKDILDTITSESLWSESDREKFDSLHNYDDSEVKVRIETLESKSHTHNNKDILDQITAPFTTEDKTKLNSLHNDDVFRGTDGMYPGIEGNVPAPSVLDVGKFLSSDGTWKSVGSDVDFVGATENTNGVHGLVPAPLAGQQSYYLRGDGTWQPISGSVAYEAGPGIEIKQGTYETYRVVEYFQSNGSQTVDTGYCKNVTNGSMNFEIKWRLVSTPTTRAVYVLSTHDVGASMNIGSVYIGVNKGSSMSEYKPCGGIITSSDGGSYFQYDTSGTATSTRSDLVGFDDDGDISFNIGRIYSIDTRVTWRNVFLYDSTPAVIYFCRIFDDDVLVCDLVPCIRDEDNVQGFYDRVREIFIENTGTAFTIGQETGEVISRFVHESESDPYEITNTGIIEASYSKQSLELTLRNRNETIVVPVSDTQYTAGDNIVVTGQQESFTLLQYIQGKGNQTINTHKRITSQEGKFEYKFQMKNELSTAQNGRNEAIICGEYMREATPFIGIAKSRDNIVGSIAGIVKDSDGSLSWYWINQYGTTTLAEGSMEYHSDGKVTKDGVDYTPDWPVINDSEIYIFGNHDFKSCCDLYYVKIYDNNVLIFDGIPVRRNSDGEIGLFDRVDNTFYMNDLGGGSFGFVAGPDVSGADPILGDYIGTTKTISATVGVTSVTQDSQNQNTLHVTTNGVTTDITFPDYVLPIASDQILGGIKVGDNLSIDANGVLSATYIAGSGIVFDGSSINAKLGIGLTFDANDAIELDDTIKIKLNCNNEPD